ncbi:hypothetical protein LTR85_003426 [Meristemomyces frigidus]|nr:hypothetical protein LTR85_003426 [Meristemomyces frigidus]
MPPRQPRPIPPLLRLPLELRQQIYSYLLPRENVSHPLPSVGITSVSHRLPKSALLNIHPHITDELLAYFYTITTWKLIFSHAFNFFRVDPSLANFERCTALRWIRKVEIVFFCDILLLKNYPSFGLDKFCEEIAKRAGRACEVLSQAKELRVVTVSWIDTTLTGGWEQKATILRPLRRLAEGRDITFRIGEINGPEDVDREKFVKAVEDVLGEGRKLETGLDGAADEHEGDPSQLRMLAFDVRQERQRAMDTREMRSCGGCGGRAGDEQREIVASAAFETLV